jgi:hypothetical protein
LRNRPHQKPRGFGSNAADLIVDRGRRVSVEQLNPSRLRQGKLTARSAATPKPVIDRYNTLVAPRQN